MKIRGLSFCAVTMRRLVRPENGVNMFLRNVGIYRKVHTALQPRRSTPTTMLYAYMLDFTQLPKRRVCQIYLRQQRQCPKLLTCNESTIVTNI
jgi:hypothetical protein